MYRNTISIFRIKSSRILFVLTLIIPLVNILNNLGLSLLVYSSTSILIGLLIFFKAKKISNIKLYLYLLLMLFVLITSLLYQNIMYDYNNIYFVYFFGFQIIFTLLLLTKINIDRYIKQYYYVVVKFIIILLSFSIIIDYILMEKGLFRYELMYRADLPNYLNRPLGLFGQPSANSTILVALFLIYIDNKDNNNKVLLFLLLTIAIILQNSGSGYFSYIILLLSFLYKKKFLRIFILPVAMIIAVYIVYSGLIYRVDINYILYNFEYFSRIIFEYFNNIFVNKFDFLLGANGNINVPIDFGPIFMIGKVGFLYYIMYLTYIMYIMYVNKTYYLKIALITLLIASLHYPVLFYPLMNILMPILLLKGLRNT